MKFWKYCLQKEEENDNSRSGVEAILSEMWSKVKNADKRRDAMHSQYKCPRCNKTMLGMNAEWREENDVV